MPKFLASVAVYCAACDYELGFTSVEVSQKWDDVGKAYYIMYEWEVCANCVDMLDMKVLDSIVRMLAGEL